jgi:hypothetical protein
MAVETPVATEHGTTSQSEDAANGWRLPWFWRKSGIAATIAINGRLCGIIAAAPSQRFALYKGMPCQGDSSRRSTRFMAPLIQPVHDSIEN